jgi:hypothetical protein
LASFPTAHTGFGTLFLVLLAGCALPPADWRTIMTERTELSRLEREPLPFTLSYAEGTVEVARVLIPIPDDGSTTDAQRIAAYRQPVTPEGFREEWRFLHDGFLLDWKGETWPPAGTAGLGDVVISPLPDWLRTSLDDETLGLYEAALDGDALAAARFAQALRSYSWDHYPHPEPLAVAFEEMARQSGWEDPVDPVYARNLKTLTTRIVSEDKLENAHEEVQKAIERMGSDPRLLQALALAEARLGNWSKAAKAMEEAIAKLDPSPRSQKWKKEWQEQLHYLRRQSVPEWLYL